MRIQDDNVDRGQVSDLLHCIYVNTQLVGGFNPSEKTLAKMDHFPKVRGENNKYLSCHHPVNILQYIIIIGYHPNTPWARSLH